MNKKEYLKMYQLEDSHFWFIGKRFFVDSTLSKHKGKIHKILDIGAGTGGMTNYLYKFGEVVGIEQNYLALKLSKKRKVKVIKGSAQRLKFKNEEFDLVTILDVLYHKNVTDEEKVISEAYRVLKKGGLLLITDSAFELLRSRHDMAVKGKRRYTLSNIVGLLKPKNFEILKASYIYFTIFPYVLIKRLLIDKLFPSKDSDVSKMPNLLNSLLAKILKFEAKLLKHTAFPLGSSVLVLAKKK